VVIPAWQPDRRLLELVRCLSELDFGVIIVVDDGSDVLHGPIFDQLRKREKVQVLRHAVNLGKGRALKTGLNHFLNCHRHFIGVVTADADGQHSAEDILAVAKELKANPSRMILGSRRFQGEIPLRSRVGNAATRSVFAVLTGRTLADTQSGLRGLPAKSIPSLLSLAGERYDYEMNVLTYAARSLDLAEVPIEAIYIDGNRSSHFNPIWDSMRIYFVLMRFFASSLIAAAIDFVVFALAFWATSDVLTSMFAGRVSSLANFALNRRFVFNSHGGIVLPLLKYYALVAAIGCAAYYSVQFLRGVAGMNVLVAKVVAETALWLVSFSIQRTVVFGSETVDRA